MELKRTCPECHLMFEAELPQTGVLLCPLCNCSFTVPPQTGPVPPAAAPLPLSAASGRQVLRGVLAVGVVLFLVGGIGYAYHLMSGIGHKAPGTPTPTASVPPASESPRPVEFIPVIPAETILPAPTLKPRPSPQPPQPQFPALPKEVSIPLPLPERVNRAIDRGVAYLLARHSEPNQYRNYLGLLGLTLLECGIRADDPTVRQIAALVRAHERQLTQTYELTLAILFLDRLGDPADRARIRTFGQQLLAGQFQCGAWTYSCLLNDRQRLQAALPSGLPNIIVPPAPNRPRAGRYGGRPGSPQRISYRGDNSNTQFAILGLWVAQRHGVPAYSALLAAEKYFRTTQADDGSWAYHPNARNWRDSMTCAGLMSLAMRYGISAGQGRDIRPDHPVSVRDAAVFRGLRYLAQSLDKISVDGSRILGAEARDPLYFLWSLERMAVIYDLKKVGEREWYPWAAEMLVESQRPDGVWAGMGEPVGTCFALLILKRSNFAKDLQLTVQESPQQSMPSISGPKILQGIDALVGQSGKPPAPFSPLDKSITRTPQSK